MGAVLVVLGVLGLVRVGWVAWSPPPGERAVAAQVAFLTTTLDDGAPQDMQALFPEGAFFMHALTGLAAASQDPALARAQLAAVDSPEIAGGFGTGMSTEHGIFHAGFSLLLATRIAQSGDDDDLAVVAERAPAVLDALLASPTGVPDSYPGGYWPCDAVVAAAAVALAADQLGRPEWIADLRTWRGTVTSMLDPDLSLLPHRVAADGSVLDPPRGSSQAIIQTFWPTLTTALDGAPDLATWQTFREAFVTSVAGLVGVREHPLGTDGDGDVDSGPLVAGISLSASAVTLAAARAVGDAALAADLDRQAELLGMPLEVAGERRYAAGLVPVGDAFLAFARSTPEAVDALAPSGPRVLWPLLALPPALLVALGLLLLRRRSRAVAP